MLFNFEADATIVVYIFNIFNDNMTSFRCNCREENTLLRRLTGIFSL